MKSWRGTGRSTPGAASRPPRRTCRRRAAGSPRPSCTTAPSAGSRRGRASPRRRRSLRVPGRIPVRRPSPAARSCRPCRAGCRSRRPSPRRRPDPATPGARRDRTCRTSRCRGAAAGCRSSPGRSGWSGRRRARHRPCAGAAGLPVRGCRRASGCSGRRAAGCRHSACRSGRGPARRRRTRRSPPPRRPS